MVIPFFPSSIFLLAAASSKSSSSSSSSIEVEVCLSPGCVADGGQNTLSKLKALAHPSVCDSIKPGKCQSLCGKGPILIQNDGKNKQQILKFMKGDEKLVPYLESLVPSLDTTEEGDDDDVNRIPEDLITGYNLVEDGLDFFSKKSYEDACENLKTGIEKAFVPAKEYGGNMEWMVHAHRTYAESLLEVLSQDEEYDDAIKSIEIALSLDPTDELSYVVLAQIYQIKKNDYGEYKALKTMFELPEVGDASSPPHPNRDIANRRRTLGFRLQKLQREVEK